MSATLLERIRAREQAKIRPPKPKKAKAKKAAETIYDYETEGLGGT